MSARNEDTDSELVRRCAAGCQDSWAELHARWGEVVFRSCMAATRETFEAEDLSSEIWIRVINGLGKFRAESTFKTWIYTIIRREIADWIGRKVRRPESQSLEPMDGDDEDRITVELKCEKSRTAEIASARDRLKTALSVLETLKIECQQALRLSWEGHTDLEISEMLGMNAKTIEARRARCEQRFYRLMQDFEQRSGQTL